MDDKENIIQSHDHFRRIQEDISGPEVQETQHKFNHLDVMNQTLKIIDIMPLDPFVKRVLCIKLVSPLYNYGKAKSNMAVALQLGASIDDVNQAEAFGVNEVSKFLESIELQQAINKFNTDVTVEKAIKRMGNPTE